jgi:hypothetical protein
MHGRQNIKKTTCKHLSGEKWVLVVGTVWTSFLLLRNVVHIVTRCFRSRCCDFIIANSVFSNSQAAIGKPGRAVKNRWIYLVEM